MSMEVVLGSIVKIEADVIVNAANTSLLGGSGVDGAIHRAAGSELLHECRLLGGCKVGEAKLTKGYLLPARFIIHTVGPVWQGGTKGEANLLTSCYKKSVQIAIDRGLNSLVFPCISTGIYKYPKKEASEIAIATCSEQLDKGKNYLKIIFCCYDQENFEIYKTTLQELG